MIIELALNVWAWSALRMGVAHACKSYDQLPVTTFGMETEMEQSAALAGNSSQAGQQLENDGSERKKLLPATAIDSDKEGKIAKIFM